MMAGTLEAGLDLSLTSSRLTVQRAYHIEHLLPAWDFLESLAQARRRNCWKAGMATFCSNKPPMTPSVPAGSAGSSVAGKLCLSRGETRLSRTCFASDSSVLVRHRIICLLQRGPCVSQFPSMPWRHAEACRGAKQPARPGRRRRWTSGQLGRGGRSEPRNLADGLAVFETGTEWGVCGSRCVGLWVLLSPRWNFHGTSTLAHATA